MEIALTKWSLDDYHRMVNAGILARRHVELIEGDIIDMVPEGPEHVYSGETLADKFRDKLQGRACIREAKPITLDNSEPEPDVAIARGSRKDYVQRHPYPDDLLLVVEISRSTLKYDLTRKRDLYARARILEYWVVDLTGRKLEIFRQSNGESYQENFTLTDGAIAPQAFPNCTVQVAEIFP